jgi:hypothetical protein
MKKLGLTREQAKDRLDAANGRLRVALGESESA